MNVKRVLEIAVLEWREVGLPVQTTRIASGAAGVESQRDSGSKPRVARKELPWGRFENAPNPNGVAARWLQRDATPLG